MHDTPPTSENCFVNISVIFRPILVLNWMGLTLLVSIHRKLQLGDYLQRHKQIISSFSIESDPKLLHDDLNNYFIYLKYFLTISAKISKA